MTVDLGSAAEATAQQWSHIRRNEQCLEQLQELRGYLKALRRVATKECPLMSEKNMEHIRTLLTADILRLRAAAA